MYSTVLWESGQSICFLSYALVYLNTAIAIAAHWSQKCCHSGTFSSMLFCTVNPLTILYKKQPKIMVLFRLGTIQESNWSAEIRETSRDRA